MNGLLQRQWCDRLSEGKHYRKQFCTHRLAKRGNLAICQGRHCVIHFRTENMSLKSQFGHVSVSRKKNKKIKIVKNHKANPLQEFLNDH